MSYCIALQDGIPPTYWSNLPKHHPSGNWGEKKDAMLFAEDKAAQAYINTHLSVQAELCKVEPF